MLDTSSSYNNIHPELPFRSIMIIFAKNTISTILYIDTCITYAYHSFLTTTSCEKIKYTNQCYCSACITKYFLLYLCLTYGNLYYSELDTILHNWKKVTQPASSSTNTLASCENLWKSCMPY